MTKEKRSRRLWTKEDIAYLSNEWGSLSIGKIAKNLGRTPESIKKQALRLKLGSHIHASELMTLSALIKAIYGKDKHDETIFYRKRWVALGLPLHRRKIFKRTLLMVNIDEFWTWLNKNRYAINISKLEPGILGKEPDWVKQKRKDDMDNPNKIRKSWFKADDDLLKILAQNNIPVDVISQKMGRTAKAVTYRMSKLKLMYRPERNKASTWTKEEDEILMKTLANGGGFIKAAKLLNRSQESCQGRSYRLWKTTNQIKLQTILQNENLCQS